MMRLFIVLLCTANIVWAHNSYTGGYSGALGTSKTCASSCHASSAGTIVVTGFPSVYQPGKTYPITVKINGGNRIINFNATTRKGTTSTIAGSFAAGLSSALYTGTDGGVYAPTHLIDSAQFQWTAPAVGTGSVTFHMAGMQGTSTGSSSGKTTKLTVSATESTTAVAIGDQVNTDFTLTQNFPNPFNPATTIGYRIANRSRVTLKVFDAAGREIATLVDGQKEAGTHSISFNASGLSSGTYFCQLTAGNRLQIRKMQVVK